MDKVLDVILKEKVIVPFLIILVAVLFYLLVRRLIRRIFSFKIHGVRVDTRRQKTMVGLIDNISKYFIALIALLMILDVFGIDTKSLIASLGVVSLVAGLALQDMLKDIIAGVGIIFEDQYAVGDVVTIGDFKGTVTYLGIKSTRLVAYTGETLIISNRNVDRVINHTLENNISLLDVEISYGSDLKKAKEVLNEVCDKLNENLKITQKAMVCGVEQLGESGITLRLLFGSNYSDKYDYERIFREEIKGAFDKNNIEIPFPQVVVHNGGDIDAK